MAAQEQVGSGRIRGDQPETLPARPMGGYALE